MPLGAIVVMSDGGDNTGGIDRDTISQLRQLRVPVHTVGFGPDHFAKDIEIVDVAAPARALPQSRLSARVAIRQHGYAGSKVKLMVRENDHPISRAGNHAEAGCGAERDDRFQRRVQRERIASRSAWRRSTASRTAQNNSWCGW